MRKILFLFISIIISGNISAQKLDWQERRKAADEVDVLIENYINTCEFSELGKSEYNTEQVEAFRSLFADDAKIIDHLTPRIAEDGNEVVVEQSVEDYTQALMERFSKGMTVKVAKLQGDYSTLDDYSVRIAMERQFRAKDENNRRFTDTSDVILDLVINEDLDEVKITKFDTGRLGEGGGDDDAPEPIAIADEMKLNIKKGDEKTSLDLARNDKNIDNACVYKIVTQPKRGTVVLDKKGYATYTPKNLNTNITADEFEYEVCKNGKCSRAIVSVEITDVPPPPPRYTGLYLSPNIAFGVGTNNTNINWGYEMRDESTFVDDIQSAGGIAIGAGLELDYYFNNNIGIGTGVQYNRISGAYDIKDFRAEYYSKDYTRDVQDTPDYRRVATLQNTTESYTINNIGIPLLLKFRTSPERNLGIFAHAGIQYNLVSSADYTIGATANFDQIRSGGDTPNSFDFEPEDNQDAAKVWVMSYDDYVEIGGETAATQQIAALREQAMSIGEYELNDGSANLDAHISLIGRVGMLYNLSTTKALKIGIQYTTATLIADRSYTLINEADNDIANYNTLLKGGTGYSSIGLNVGLSMRFGNKRNRM